MSEPFLILHKVRSEPAFDVASKMDCPICIPTQNLRTIEECSECDGQGYWWIIPTSGHRAYPYWYRALNEIELNGWPQITVFELPASDNAIMPEDWPDHYACNNKSSKSEGGFSSLLERLGLVKKIERRI